MIRTLFGGRPVINHRAIEDPEPVEVNFSSTVPVAVWVTNTAAPGPGQREGGVQTAMKAENVASAVPEVDSLPARCAHDSKF